MQEARAGHARTSLSKTKGLQPDDCKSVGTRMYGCLHLSSLDDACMHIRMYAYTYIHTYVHTYRYAYLSGYPSIYLSIFL